MSKQNLIERRWEIPANTSRPTLIDWLEDCKRISARAGVETNPLGLPDGLVIDPDDPETYRGSWVGREPFDTAVAACLVRLRNRVPAARAWIEGEHPPGWTEDWRKGVNLVADIFG